MPPRLSQRVQSLKPSATLAVSNRVAELTVQGVDVIDFGVGEPDFTTPANIRQAAIDALHAGQTHYKPVPGPVDVRSVIAAKLRDENGIDCHADDICISAGAKHSIYLALQCLLDPPREGGEARTSSGSDGLARGEAGQPQEVLLPTPAWVSYAPMSQLAGGRVIEVPGSIDNDFKITPDQLAKAITPGTAVLILNSPSNPCGTMYSPGELRALADVLIPHEHVTIISDEIYEKLIYTEVRHFSIGSIPALADRVITVNGMSKAFAMTGWRIGYACCPGKGGAGLAKAMSKLQGQMTSNITSFCYPAIVEALQHGTEDVEIMRRAFASRAALIAELVGKWPCTRCARPTGAFYVFPDVRNHLGKTTPAGRRIDSALAFAAALLEEARVAVVPGEDFGQCARTHVRLSFATSEDNIREGCERIRSFLSALR